MNKRDTYMKLEFEIYNKKNNNELILTEIYLQKRLQFCNYFIQIHQLALKNKGKSNII